MVGHARAAEGKSVAILFQEIGKAVEREQLCVDQREKIPDTGASKGMALKVKNE